MMRYPTLPPHEVDRLLSELLASCPRDVDPTRAVKWVGMGPDLDLAPIERAVDELRARFEAAGDRESGHARDSLEGQGALLLAQALSGVPYEVLDDPGFWRYLSLTHLWWFVKWRHQETFDEGDLTKARVYVDGRKNTECVPLRMYLRGRIALDVNDDTIATAASDAVDLWRSHILRVRISYVPDLAAELVRQQADPERRMPTEQLRKYVKRINRVGSNLVLPLYTAGHAKALLDELHSN